MQSSRGAVAPATAAPPIPPTAVPIRAPLPPPAIAPTAAPPAQDETLSPAEGLAVVFEDTLFGTEEYGRYAPLVKTLVPQDPVLTLHPDDAASPFRRIAASCCRGHRR